jgi:uncharacterized protein (TIGR00369 family)
VTDTESSHTPDLDSASDFLVAAGLRFTHVAADRVEGVIDLGPEHHQPWGLVHGGVYTTAIESAATVGAVTAASEHAFVAVGVNNNTNFLRSMISGRVQVVARPIQQGRTQQLWEVSISDADGRLVAVGQVRLQNVVPRTDSAAAGGRSPRSDAAAHNERNSPAGNRAPADGRGIHR